MGKAKVAVVFPVHNGAATLSESLASIASQHLQDFKAIILENGCTDNTFEIALQFCEKDPRFSIVRNDHFLSANDNFAKAMELAAVEGEYFCLRACDDLSSPDFLSALVEALEQDSDKLVAVCSTQIVTREGQKLAMKHPSSKVLNFLDLYKSGSVPRNLTYPGEWIYGVFRSAAKDTLVSRWHEFANPWCVASYTMSEFVVRDLVAYVSGPVFIFRKGSNSIERYGAKSFRDKLQQRLAYTFGCYKLVHKLPKVGLVRRLKFFRMCWNDARRKTQYKLLRFF
ncbi:glycosyltransferase [Rhizobium sp. Root1220]|uniref:glycosyltransferase family 2 protein n=1 Tax=Rhizobium sp. Root1220 TaxID=1736432 RepID=UPI0006FDE405|nr:glycosyltransferase [Rhizobium sp. Root1220]KQV83601.1 glycosyl transferase [Rhizobium sp. Root1220]